MISLVWNYERLTGQKATYIGEYKALGGKNPVGVIPYFSDMAPLYVDALMSSGDPGDINPESLGLNREIMRAWAEDNTALFGRLRGAELMKIEKALLESAGLEITTDEPAKNLD